MVVELLEDIGDVVVAIDYVEMRELVKSYNEIFRSCFTGIIISPDIGICFIF